MASSLAQQLRLLRHSCSDSILFYHQSAHNTAGKRQRQQQQQQTDHYLTYDQCWQIVAEHQQWLQKNIVRQHTTKNRDVIIGYLADNSPDLLLSVLACMNLTTTSSSTLSLASSSPAAVGGTQVNVLPAMINVRWTPLEMERALRPSSDTANIAGREDDGSNDVHVTILLYGLGYERAAKEAVRLMNQPKTQQMDDGTYCISASHFAVAMSLPELAGKYPGTKTMNVSNNNDSPSREIKQHSNNNNHYLNSEDDVSNADALLLFTSGTSSPKGAKGVRLSHRSLLVQARAKTQHPCRYDSQTNVVATTVPWFHVGGMSSALAVILGGGCLVFPPMGEECSSSSNNRKEDGVRKKGFQPGRVLQSIQPRYLSSMSNSTSIAANTLVVVPAMLHAIVDYAQNNQQCPSFFPNVRLILVGGQSIGNGRLYEQTRQLFPRARIVQTYACTEAGSSITFEDLGWNHVEQKDGTYQSNGLDGATRVGSPPPHIQIGIFDTRANSITSLLPHGKMGIIGTRGPHTMSGYWDRRGSNVVCTKSKDDWMLTNDLGYIHPQSGKLFFCGRANDVIRTGGESVLATEVERILDTHEDIMECAVFALPDDKFGEAVCAAIVLEEASLVTSPRASVAVVKDVEWTKRIRQHCAEHQLAGFKQPRRVFCVQALPRNSSGKVLKHAIIKLCASQSKETSRL